ncbi:MAG: hypothetical protein IJQ28_06830 [Clostridia bacterium]|nr:hypothetical protein [Clostridia bacterium]
MNSNIVNIAASVMKITPEEAEKHYTKIENIDAYYFWNPARGGISVIVAENGEKLGATSSVSYERHIEAFLNGKRN